MNSAHPISEVPPVWPCWLWQPTPRNPKRVGYWFQCDNHEQYAGDMSVKPDDAPTHWHADQVTAPTCIPGGGGQTEQRDCNGPTLTAEHAKTAERILDVIKGVAREHISVVDDENDFFEALKEINIGQAIALEIEEHEHQAVIRHLATAGNGRDSALASWVADRLADWKANGRGMCAMSRQRMEELEAILSAPSTPSASQVRAGEELDIDEILRQETRLNAAGRARLAERIASAMKEHK